MRKALLRYWSILALSGGLLACIPPQTERECPLCSGADGGLPDASTVDSSHSEDAGDEPEPIHFVRAELADNSVVSGQWIATYDQNLWWDSPSPVLHHAIFQPQRYADYPNDNSIKVVASTDLLAFTSQQAPQDHVGYRTFLRQRFTIHTLPLSDPVFVFTGNTSYHREENGQGDFAWDLVYSDEHGGRYLNDGTQNEDFRVWDAEVYAPIDGYVVEVIRDEPDNAPGSYPPGALENMVGLHLGGSFYLYLLHFKQGSIATNIQVGDTVHAGRYLGRVGNSGVTYEPHLHMSLLWYDEQAGRSWSVPMEFSDVYCAPAPTGPYAFYPYLVPISGTWLRSQI